MNPLLSALVQAGVITQADADRINRSLDPDAARLWAEQQLVIATQGGLSAQQQRLVELVRRGNVTPAALDAFWAAEDARLWTALRPAWVEVAAENAIGMAVRLGADDAMWNTVNEAMLSWVDAYYVNADAASVGSIPNLNLTSRTQFAQVFEQWQRGELEVGTRADGFGALIEALVPTFGPDRASVIAMTESTRITTESLRAAAEQDEFVTHYRFLTSSDALVCPICGPNHGRVIAKTAAGFPMGGNIAGFPPLHPRCRCGLVEESELTAQQPLPPEERYHWSGDAYAAHLRDQRAAQRKPNAVRTLTGG